MKFLRYGPRGEEKPGLLDAAGHIRDLSGHIDDLSGLALDPGNLAVLASLDPAELPLVESPAQDDVRLGPCVGGTRKFIGIGLNFADHAAETGAEVPPEPVMFNKWISCIVGPDDNVVIPRGSEKTDWEVELGVVIGKEGLHIEEADAMNYVAGFCLVNDVSERDHQMNRSGSWDKGKGHDTFGPVGPWLVTPDEVGDYDNLKMWLEVDGHRYQDGNTSTMVYKVPFLVSYVSQFMRLEPGDIITTGTPPGVGVGQKPPVYLKGGELMTLGIEKLGVQTQKVVRA